MNDTNYYVDLYRQRAKRVRWLILLLITLFGLTLVDFWVTQWRFGEFRSRLPLLLYDFQQKYSKPLTKWWPAYISRPESASLRASDPGVIRFQNHSESDTVRGVNWHRIPLLDEFLARYHPSVRDSRRLLGWELPTPVYLVVALGMPSAILIWLLIALRFLNRIHVLLRALTPSKTTALIMQSILADRIDGETRAGQLLRAAVVTIALFAFASAAAALVVMAPLNAATVYIEGALFLNSSRFPIVSLTPTDFPWLPRFWSEFLWMVVAANAVLSLLIGRELARRRS